MESLQASEGREPVDMGRLEQLLSAVKSHLSSNTYLPAGATRFDLMDVCGGFVGVSLLEGDTIGLRFNPYGGATYEWVILPDGRFAGEASWWHDGTVTSDGCEGGGNEVLGLPSRRLIDAILNHPRMKIPQIQQPATLGRKLRNVLGAVFK